MNHWIIAGRIDRERGTGYNPERVPHEFRYDYDVGYLLT